MKIIDLCFLTDNYDKDDVIDEYIDNLVHSLRMQGRITGKPLSLLENGNKYSINCRIPEYGALKRIKINKWYKKLQDKNVQISIIEYGEDMWSPDICQCTEYKFYILSGSRPIPILCGTCMNAIPLYKLPFTYESDPSYYDVIQWNQENYALNTLEFQCSEEVEKFAQDQLCNIDSEHTQDALEICKKIKKLTKINCFYDFENLKDEVDERNEVFKLCPSCNSKWVLEESLHNTYDFKCDKCKILSNFSYSIQNECRKIIKENRKEK